MTRRGMSPRKAAELRAKKGIEETKLQKIRVAKGLSQSELAELSGVPKRRIVCYEQGETMIDRARLETLCDLATALNCKIEDLLENKELKQKYKAIN